MNLSFLLRVIWFFSAHAFCSSTVIGHNVSKSALLVAPRARHFLFFGTKALHSSQQNRIIAHPPFLVSLVVSLHSSLLFIHPCFLGTHLTPPHHNCGFPLCVDSHKSCQSVAPEQAIKPTDHQSSHLPLVFIPTPMMKLVQNFLITCRPKIFSHHCVFSFPSILLASFVPALKNSTSSHPILAPMFLFCLEQQPTNAPHLSHLQTHLATAQTLTRVANTSFFFAMLLVSLARVTPMF